jgi:hypothetical protein
MKLDGVRDIADANEYLEKYVVEHNKRYAKAARDGDEHRPLPDWAEDIDDVCFIVVERQLKNDWAFNYKDKTYQIPRQSIYPPTKSKIKIKSPSQAKLSHFTGERKSVCG